MPSPLKPGKAVHDMLEKTSKTFIRIMLGIYMLLLGLGVLLGTLGKLANPSYILEFLAAAAFFLCLWFFRDKLGKFLENVHLPGTFITGLILSFFCLLLNLAWVLVFQIEPTVDFQTFYDTALAIARNERVDMLYIGLFPHILGYSTFLGLMMRLLGESAMLAPVLNVVLTLISGLCIYILCLRWLELKAAAAAFFLWSICPSKLMYNAMVMSEPLYTCLILLFLLLLSLALDRKLHRRLRLLAAIPLGLACGALLLAVNATRPVAVILFVAFFIWALLLRGRQLKELKGWLVLAAFTLSMFGAYSYCDRQWFRWEYLHIFERTSDIPAYNIYVGLNMDSLGSYSEEDMDTLMNYRYQGGAVYAQEQMLEEVKERLSSGEIDFPRLFAAKLAKLMGNDEGGAFYAQAELSPLAFKLSSAVSNVFYYFVVLLSLFGALRLFKKPVFSTVYLAPLYSIGLILAHLIVEVSGRYKYSLIPMLIIMAVFAFGEFETKDMMNAEKD